MYTTNTFSASDPGTFASVRSECAKALDFAERAELIAIDDPQFADSENFRVTKAALREHLLAALSLLG